MFGKIPIPTEPQQLFISPKTVHNHVSHIFEKAGLANRAEATAYAIRHGIADEEPLDS